jgi:hypothetical protein
MPYSILYCDIVFLCNVLRFLVANAVTSSTILVILIMEAILSYETSVLKTATRRNIQDGILHSDRPDNLKSQIALTGWAMQRRRIVFPVRYKLDFISQKTRFFRSKRFSRPFPIILLVPQKCVDSKQKTKCALVDPCPSLL